MHRGTHAPEQKNGPGKLNAARPRGRDAAVPARRRESVPVATYIIHHQVSEFKRMLGKDAGHQLERYELLAARRHISTTSQKMNTCAGTASSAGSEINALRERKCRGAILPMA